MTYDENDEAVYEYHLKDHLGNVRIAFADKDGDGYIEPFSVNPNAPNGGGDGAAWNLTDTEILQESHYYPFGMVMDGAWQDIVNDPQNNYLYNGKELNTDFGLDWSDYGARYYDAAIGRWNGVDPLAENYVSMNPYNYVLNNPIKFIDPDGMRVDVTDLVKGNTESDKNILLQLMIDLSDMSGSKIKVNTNEEGKSTLIENGCNDKCTSSSSVGYISHLLNDDSDEVRVMNNDRNPNLKNKKGGSQASPNGDIYLDANQISGIQSSLEKGGVAKETMSYGLVFLHEALHTKFGASYYKTSKDNKEKVNGRFIDPVGGFAQSSTPGDVVKRINVFRAEMGLPSRDSYGGHNPSELIFGGKHVKIAY